MTRMMAACALAAAAIAAMLAQGQGDTDRLTAEAFDRFAFRSIGPSLTTGRVADIDVDPKNPSIWYARRSAGSKARP
jgi:hypothetical protein